MVRSASLVALTLSCLCEVVWVLRKVYRFSRDEVSAALSVLLELDGVVLNRPAVEAGLLALAAGGDFADGVIAYEGRWLGGEVFVSFRKKAVALVQAQGLAARLL